MKKFICGFCAGTLLSGCMGVLAITYLAAPAEFKVLVNGTEFISDPPTLVVEGRTYLPLRAMGEALGIPVNWNDELGQAEVGQVSTSSQSDNQTIKGYTFFGTSVKSGIISIATVEVTNNNSNQKMIMFTATFYDANGVRIGTGMGVVNDFESGETRTINLICQEDVSSYSTVKYQIDVDV